MNIYGYDKRYLQELSRKQLKVKIGNIINGPCPDYPDYEFEPVRRHILIASIEGSKPEVIHLELLHSDKVRIDQYPIQCNGKQLHINRRGKVIWNESPKPLVLGFQDAVRLAASKFPRVGRFST